MSVERPGGNEAKPTWKQPKAHGWRAPGTQWREAPGSATTRSDDQRGLTWQERELERRLLHLSIEHSPIFLFALDAKGTFVVAGGGAVGGYVKEQAHIIGRTLDEWLDDVPQARDAFDSAVNGQAASWEGTLAERSYECHLSPVLDPEGRLVVIAGVAFECTAHHRADAELRRRQKRLEGIVEGTVFTLNNVIEEREPYLAGHQRRTAQLALAIATELGWDEGRLESLGAAARLHDLGRLTCPAGVLNRPGRLRAEEIPLVQAHCAAGAAMLADMRYDGVVVDVVRQHHERLDGSGYPGGLTEPDILMEARVISVADVLEAMTSARPHRAAHELHNALAEMRAGRGRLFDADALDACERVLARGFPFR